MCTKLVSIIVPVYNVEKYLTKCLDSICNQTYKKIEIIIVNDGTKDNSGEICESFSSHYSFIKYIKKLNGGLASARNAALDICTGDYIMCVDSDDWVELNMVEHMVGLLETYDADMAVCDYYLNYFNKQVYDSKTETDIEILDKNNAMLYAILPRKYYGFAWNKIYKHKLINTLRYNEKILKGEDSPFTCEYIDRCNKVVYAHVPLYHYRIDSVSISRSKFNIGKMTVLDSYSSIICMLERKNYDSKLICLQKEQYANQLLSLLVNIARNKKKFKNETSFLRGEMKKYKEIYLKSTEIDTRHKLLYRLGALNFFIFCIVCKIIK